MLGIRNEKEGRLRVTYAQRDDAKIFELRSGPEGQAGGRGPDRVRKNWSSPGGARVEKFE